MMPELNGFEVIEYVRPEPPELMPSIVVITAASKHTLQDFDDSAVGALIRKPFDIHSLIDIIDRVTGTERPERYDGGTPPRTSAYLVRSNPTGDR